MNGYNFTRHPIQHPILQPPPLKSLPVLPKRAANRVQINQYNQEWNKQPSYKTHNFDKPFTPLLKMATPSPKSYQKSEGILSMPIKKREVIINNQYGATSVVNSQEPIKSAMSSSTGSKKGVLSSLWSTNSDRKSYEVEKSVAVKSEYNLENLRDDSIFHDFKILKDIGQGKFSKVSIALHKPSGMILGLKTIKKKTIAQESLMTQLLREIKILSYVNHTNIVSLYKVFSYGDNIYLVEELGCDGELFSRMENKKFSEEATSFIMRSLLSAVSYLHSHNIIHRDIKPENVIMVHGIVKLCDLGWSVHTKSKFRETLCGTPLYASPELLQGGKYNEKIDLWALGIMAYQLRFGYTPFNVKSKSELYKVITDDIDFTKEAVSDQFQHFVKSLLQKNPKQRLTAEMMLKHPFILHYKEFETCEELCLKPQ